MKNSCAINVIYETLANLKFQLFCNNKDSKCRNNIIQSVTKTFLNDDFILQDYCEKTSINLICLIENVLKHIEKCTSCCDNYAYLLQIQKLKCIVKNLEKLLCQLKCLQFENCCLFSKLVCTLYKIIELLDNIISKINNLECLCKSHIYCDDKIIECILCSLIEDIDLLEENVLLLSQMIVEIASQNIINCTPCTTTKSVVIKEHGCCNDDENYIYNKFKYKK